MIFIPKHFDGAARIGTLKTDHAITTPNIFIYKTKNFNPPKNAELIVQNTNNTLYYEQKIHQSYKKIGTLTTQLFFPPKLQKIIPDNLLEQTQKTNNISINQHNKIKPTPSNKTHPLINTISHSTQIYNKPDTFLKTITDLRTKLKTSQLLYLPALTNPQNLAFFCYLGIDLFDNAQAIQAATNQTLLYPEGPINIDNNFKNPCLCKTCQSTPQTDMHIEDILAHNNTMLFKELHTVHNAIQKGRLRELVEIRVRADPQQSALLHILDTSYQSYLEHYCPIYRKSGLVATTHDALFRPEINRFQKRILGRCKKPEGKHILLLLPCSAKKPYSRSKTHKLIKSRLNDLDNQFVIHEVIVTSPLGIVPRELERIYPAGSYDISVSGLWSLDEQNMIINLVKKWTQQQRYDSIVIHLPESIQSFLTPIFDKAVCTCKINPISNISLEMLTSELTDLCSQYDRVSKKQHIADHVYNVAAYQFGPELADILLKDASIRGKEPFFKIFHRSQQLAMITSPRNLFSLTLFGAEILHDQKKNWVQVDSSFSVKGSIFAPGVIDADSDIRIGDEVCIIQDDVLKGVGVAMMPGEEIRKAEYGEVVKLRHHVDS